MRRLSRAAAILGAILAATPAAGQAVALQWGAFVNGDLKNTVEDRFGSGIGVTGKKALHVAADGTSLAVGNSYNPKTGDFDFLLVKLNADGTEAWKTRVDGPASGNDYPYALGVDGVGNIYVCGAMQNALKKYEFGLVKFNPDGTTAWVSPATYNNGLPTRDHFGWTLAVTAAGEAYVVGQSHNGIDFDCAVVRFDTNGNQLGVARFDGGLDDFAYAAALDGGGNLLITGQSDDGLFFNFRTIKYAAALGAPIWNVVFDGPAGRDDFAYDLTLDGAGDVYVTGASESAPGNLDFLTIKYVGGTGAPAWGAPVRYDGTGGLTDTAHAVIVNAGAVYVCGASEAPDAQADYAVIAYNAATGAQLWAARYDGGSGADFAYALAVDTAGDVYVTGYSRGKSRNDVAVIKLRAADGFLLRVNRFDNGGDDFGLAIAVLGVDSFIVGGFTANNLFDLCVLKFGPVTATDDAYAADEDAVLAITTAATGVLANDSDPDGSALIAVLVTGPTNGTLRLNRDGTFTYTPNPDFNGIDTFTYLVRDIDGVESGPATATITVNALNDDPILSVPGTQIVTPALVFSTANFNPVIVFDVDAGAADVQLTLTVDFGTLTLATTTGLTSVVGNGADTVVLVGTVAEVNTAIDGLIYAYDPAFKGVAELTVDVDDLGNTGGGGAKTAGATILIITSGQACRDLIAKVQLQAIPQKLKDKLSGKLNSAAKNYDRGKFTKGDAKLVGFQDAVADNSPAVIPPVLAAELIADAQAIIDATP